MQEIQVQFIGREDPLEKEMATHSSILAQRIILVHVLSSFQILLLLSFFLFFVFEGLGLFKNKALWCHIIMGF